ncbi:TetR/AcrR family transcriptional regulator [Zhongshania sp. BJYM1]|uniref:TetR/AcrR family transcriptional regulator n=1 Tax=Zhongshania aquatica TaxID=2965069 RepID=UPI0022B2B1DA|nr:TetR/AcrR family transcriptional regulator [Marortus sp. BJYM1]
MPQDIGMTKRERTRAHILHTGATLFSKSGYSGVSMDGLGKACRLTKGALYDHFNSKEDVYTHCVAHYIECAISDIFSMSLTEESYSSEERLFSFVESFLTRLQADLVLRRLIQRLLIDSNGVDLASVTELALLRPFSYVVDLLMQYKPGINAKIQIYSFFCSAIMAEDLRVIADLLSPEFKDMTATQTLLEHFKNTIQYAPGSI